MLRPRGRVRRAEHTGAKFLALQTQSRDNFLEAKAFNLQKTGFFEKKKFISKALKAWLLIARNKAMESIKWSGHVAELGRVCGRAGAHSLSQDVKSLGGERRGDSLGHKTSKGHPWCPSSGGGFLAPFPGGGDQNPTEAAGVPRREEACATGEGPRAWLH